MSSIEPRFGTACADSLDREQFDSSERYPGIFYYLLYDFHERSIDFKARMRLNVYSTPPRNIREMPRKGWKAQAWAGRKFTLQDNLR